MPPNSMKSEGQENIIAPCDNSEELYHLKCDYLVVGAGTSGMSFVDTLLTEHESASVIIVDRNAKAGGHWTTAYPFVRLHQPSCSYGVNSLRLGKLTDSKGREKEDAHERATAQEILEYYEKLKDNFLDSGRVRFIFGAEYYQKEEDGSHMVSLLNPNNKMEQKSDDSIDESYQFLGKKEQIYQIECKKVVRCISKVIVPSMRQGPTFPVDDCINVKTVNELPNEIDKFNERKRYVVVGAGKTGSDAITYLLENGVNESDITWVISRDMWYNIRDGFWPTNNQQTWKDKKRYLKAYLKSDNCADICLYLEKKGIMGRLRHDDGSEIPKVFKGATIDRKELDMLRSIKNVIRMGRITSIDSESINLEQGSIPLSSLGMTEDILLIDCMAENSFGFENIDDKIKTFEPRRINVGLGLQYFNPSFCAAIVGYIEATFNDDHDDLKNSFCYYPSGEFAKPNLQAIVVFLYAQLKTLQALGQHKSSAIKFILSSRTSMDSPLHHGGLIKLLWAAVSPPLMLAKSGNDFVRKVENGHYGDLDTNHKSFINLRRTIPKVIPKNAVRNRKKKKKKKTIVVKDNSLVQTD